MDDRELDAKFAAIIASLEEWKRGAYICSLGGAQFRVVGNPPRIEISGARVGRYLQPGDRILSD
jgi:hypothetical protein